MRVTETDVKVTGTDDAGLVALAQRPRAIALAAAMAVFSVAYLRWAPLAPDLAAQVARTNVVRAEGVSSWWTGWFGGMLLPDYSLLAPSSMAVLGVRATAVLAVVITVAATRVLARDAVRPRAAVFACAAASVADVVNGRVTFAAGVAVAALALVAVRGRRSTFSSLLAVCTYAVSPLAGLFLGIIMLAVVLTDRSRRRQAVIGSVGLVAVAGIMAWFFPGTGRMPFSLLAALPAILCCVGVLVFCRPPIVRVTAMVTLVATGALLLYPAAIGENITRLAWLAAVPITVATASLPSKRLVAVVSLLLLWPVTDLVGQLHSGDNPSAHAVFYQALIQRLDQERAAAPASATGERLEVLDTSSHWSSVYLAARSLARGWDRQADRSDNPIFYQPGALTPLAYHSWLRSLAVGWVAVPHAPLDYASQGEAAIIASGPAYLDLVWSNPNWRLYRVVDAAPLVSGAVVSAVHGTDIEFDAKSAGSVMLRVRWSPYLTLLADPSGDPVNACVTDEAGFTKLVISHPGNYKLVSHFDPGLSLHRADPDCQRDLGSAGG